MDNKLSKKFFLILQLLFLISLANLINSPALGSSVHNLYNVKIEHGQRPSVSGTVRSYVLYIPQANSDLPKPPYPLVVMIHGFLMTANQQQFTSTYLAQHGIAVFSPNMTKILLGDKTRSDNVKDVVGQTKWLIEQSAILTSPYYGLVDPKRTAIAGNSSGGAVCFEAVLEAQKEHIPFHAMCAMEGVPWDRTLDKVSQVEPMQILCLRAEPCLCNFHYNILKYIDRLKFPVDDVKVNGAHHCDAENPTSIGCMSVCGSSHEKYRQLFKLLTYTYLRDVLKAPQFEDSSKSFIDTVASLQKEGKVEAHLNNLKSTIAGGSDFDSKTAKTK